MDNQSNEPVGEEWKLNPDYHRMSDFLGVNVYDRNDSELAKKIYALKDWAMEKGKGKSITDALWQVRNLQKELGHQFIGKPLIIEMYKNIRLMENRKQESIDHPVKAVPEVKVGKKEQSLGTIEAAIQKVVKKTITEAMKGAIK